MNIFMRMPFPTPIAATRNFRVFHRMDAVRRPRSWGNARGTWLWDSPSAGDGRIPATCVAGAAHGPIMPLNMRPTIAVLVIAQLLTGAVPPAVLARPPAVNTTAPPCVDPADQGLHITDPPGGPSTQETARKHPRKRGPELTRFVTGILDGGSSAQARCLFEHRLIARLTERELTRDVSPGNCSEATGWVTLDARCVARSLSVLAPPVQVHAPPARHSC